MSEEVENHIIKRFNLIKKVGSGAYGHVWKATQRKTGQLVAVKKIFDAFQHSTDAQRTYREIVFLHQLDHPNIIKLHEVIRAENDKDLYLIFEYMEADLHNAISQKILKDIHNRFIMYQLAKGIKFIHSAQLLHRDLKPSNILLNSDCILKICDFGLARSLASDEEGSDVVLTEQVATRWYRSPQVLLGSQTYDKSADVWSIGCILAEILIGKPIFPGNSTLNQLERILSFTGKPKKQDILSLNSEIAYTMIQSISDIKLKNISQWFKQQVPQDAINLVFRMLQFNPQKRLTINQILSHQYLAKFHNPKEEYESKKIINPPISDNKKLNLKQYRLLIYQRIKQVYSHTFNQNNQLNDNQKPNQNILTTQKELSQYKQYNPSSHQTQQKSLPKRESFKPVNSYISPSTQQPNTSQPNNQQSFNTSNQNLKHSSNTPAKQPVHESSIQKQRPSSTALRQNTFYTTVDNQNAHQNLSQNHSSTNTIQNIIQRQNKQKNYESYNQDQKIKKKNSLKEMIKNKKASPSFKEEYSNANTSNFSSIGNTHAYSGYINNITRNYSTSNSFANINKYYKNNPSNYRESSNYSINTHAVSHKPNMNKY